MTGGKVAFCFMSYGDIEQQQVWSAFFKDVNPARYRIWLHRADGKGCSKLRDVECIKTMPTKWGGWNLVDVAQALFEEACVDRTVQKCILLSGDCIPVRGFDHVYSQVLKDDCSWFGNIGLDKHHGEEGIDKSDWPRNWGWKYRKASQWAVLSRAHVLAAKRNWRIIRKTFEHGDIPDEHAYITFITSTDPTNVRDRVVMHVNWTARKQLSCPLDIDHRRFPKTYHEREMTRRWLNKLLRENRDLLFVRKICKSVTIQPWWL